MRQVLQHLRTGELEVADLPAPGVRAGSVLIRTRRSLISAGTERMLVEFSKANLIQKARQQPERVKQVLDKIRTDGLAPTLEAVFRKLDEPLPLGYCNAGEVLEVGRGVHDLAPGDRVISNGAHAELVCVPRNLVAAIPDGVADEEAAFTVLGSIALQGIRLAAPQLGERFVVFGAGLLGLLTVQLLRANGLPGAGGRSQHRASRPGRVVRRRNGERGPRRRSGGRRRGLDTRERRGRGPDHRVGQGRRDRPPGGAGLPATRTHRARRRGRSEPAAVGLLREGAMGASETRARTIRYPAGPDALFDPAVTVVLVDGRTRNSPEWLAQVLRAGGAPVAGERTPGVPFLGENVDVPGWPVQVRIATGWWLDPGAPEPRPLAGVEPDLLVAEKERAVDAALELLGVLTMIHSALLACSLLLSPQDASEPAFEPVALAEGRGADEVFAASATGELVRVVGREVAGRWRIAPALSDLVAIDEGERLAAVDPAGGEVLVLSSTPVEVVSRFPVPAPSTVVQAAGDLVVASGETRTLTVLSHGEEPRSIALAFPPREMLADDARGRLFVADAFGGALAEIDSRDWSVRAVRGLSGHNLRGLALDGDGTLHVAHQVLDALGRTTFDDVHWGNLVRNVVRRIGPGGGLLHLGDVGRGAGDPATLHVDAAGGVVVALAGTDELLLRGTDGEERRLPVGRRPSAVLPRPDGTFVVANALGGSLSFVDPSEGDVETVLLGPAPGMDPVARGRSLFFDARLSHDGWMSCHSCHSEGHTPELLADTLGDGTHGTPKRVPSLRGVGETAPYAWDGSQPTLEEQLEKTLRTTMHAEEVDRSTVDALAAFLRTLPAPPARPAEDPPVVARGRELFGAAGCVDCHVPPLFTSDGAFLVGLTDEAGASEFNPPSLRGVGRRSRFFHDGRYRDLERLLAEADHPGTETFDAADRSSVTAFLRTL